MKPIEDLPNSYTKPAQFYVENIEINITTSTTYDFILLPVISLLRSNSNSRGVNTREGFLSCGHNFVGCGSYDLGIWQDVSTMSPLSSYVYLLEPLIQAIDPSFVARKCSIKNQCSRLLNLLSTFKAK